MRRVGIIDGAGTATLSIRRRRHDSCDRIFGGLCRGGAEGPCGLIDPAHTHTRPAFVVAVADKDVIIVTRTIDCAAESGPDQLFKKGGKKTTHMFFCRCFFLSFPTSSGSPVTRPRVRIAPGSAHGACDFLLITTATGNIYDVADDPVTLLFAIPKKPRRTSGSNNGGGDGGVRG